MPNIDKIVKDFKNRKVFKSASIYLATSFVLLQAAQLIIPVILIPEWIFKLLVVIAILGFPVIIIFSWIYDITPTSEDVIIETSKNIEVEDMGDTTLKVSPSSKSIILISTLMGIIFYTNILPLLRDIINADHSSISAAMSPDPQYYTKDEHPQHIIESIRLIRNYLSQRDKKNTLEALYLTEMLIIEDSTKADYYAYRGWVYFQLYNLNEEKSTNLLLESEKDLLQAIELAKLEKMTQDPAVITYLHLASIYLIQDKVDEAYSKIKKAMWIDKKYPDVIDKLKEINRKRIQVLEKLS